MGLSTAPHIIRFWYLQALLQRNILDIQQGIMKPAQNDTFPRGCAPFYGTGIKLDLQLVCSSQTTQARPSAVGDCRL